jgi:hypothetical protein
MPYKYLVATDSISFADAPPSIITALLRLTWAGKHAVKNEDFKDFNELLSVAYFDKGKMGVSALPY